MQALIMDTGMRIIRQQLDDSAQVQLNIKQHCIRDIYHAGVKMIDALRAGGKLLICGNGGSAADSQHFAAEMVGRFKKERRAIPVLALSTDTSILTAIANDYDFDRVFARQVEALGAPGDVLVCISTSGQSENLLRAAGSAKQKEMISIGLLGGDGGRVSGIVDAAVTVPGRASERIQEGHITVIHIWCEMIERSLFPDPEYGQS